MSETTTEIESAWEKFAGANTMVLAHLTDKERALLRVCFHAGYVEGQAITRPVKLDGKRLTMNASTSANGYVKTVVLDENGVEVPGFGAADAADLIGDAVDLTVAWKGSRSLGELRGRVVQLKFLVCDADLYSFAVQDE